MKAEERKIKIQISGESIIEKMQETQKPRDSRQKQKTIKKHFENK